MRLFVCDRPMFYSPWDDDQFAFFEPDVSISKLHAKTTTHNEEQLIFVFMMVPNEFALKLDEFHELTVEFADDTRAPVLVQKSELLAEIQSFPQCGSYEGDAGSDFNERIASVGSCEVFDRWAVPARR